MLFSLLLGLSYLLRVGQPMLQGQTYAVVVGISDYKALTYTTGDLRFADRDARQVVEFLMSKVGGSVPSSHIQLLTNRQAALANIQQAFQLFGQASASDRILLYFSGHGLPDSFVPYDARPGDLRSLLTYRAIKEAFRDSKAMTKLCIADACLSGGITQQTNRRALTQPSSDESNVAMMLASRSTQSAVEDSRLAGGAFTYFMLKGLKGQGDLDGDRIVTIRELHRYVSPQVKKRTKGRQTPIFYGRFPDNLPLAYL